MNDQIYKRAEMKEKLIAREASKPGLRGALNAKCIECLYDPYQEGTWREQVEKCTCYSCPLYPKRPVPEKMKKRVNR